jgi:two-component system NarL family sensor kinase
MPFAPASAAASADLDAIVLEHAYRGVRLQLVLRGILVVFIVLTLTVVPPVHHAVFSDVIVACYGLWALSVAAWTWRGGPGPVRLIWLALFADLAVLATLVLVAGASPTSWTSDVLVTGFVLIPVLAATQLRPLVCASVVLPTIAVYFAASAATRQSNEEPWASILLRTLVLTGIGVGCIALSAIQRSRVSTIGDLVRNRTSLLDQLMTAEERERRGLAEHLHDGALQYVLAARQDLEDAQELADQEAFSRVETALTESSRLLRSTVAQLHPAVLEGAGLARTLRDVAADTQARAGCVVQLDVDGWPEDLRTPLDGLLYTTARELLTNVVKHASARTVRLELRHDDGIATLVIADDGRGITPEAEAGSIAAGHIGLASHRVRVEAAGGSLIVRPRQPNGTIAYVVVPTHSAHTMNFEARLAGVSR